MDSVVLQITIIAALVFAVFMGEKLKVNIGIICIAFAYIICCLIMGEKVSVLMGYWPVSLTFAQIGVTYFYGFANKNGTMTVLSEKLIYPFRNRPKLIPFAIYFISALLCAMGTSTLAVVVLMSALAVSVVKKASLNPLLAALAVVMGCPAGNSVPWAEVGIILRGLIDVYYEPSVAGNYSVRLSFIIFCTLTVIFSIMYFIFKGYRCSMSEMKTPDKFNATQKTTLSIMFAVLGLVLIPAVINKILPNEACAFMVGHFDIRALAFIGGAVCTCLKLAKEKEVVAAMPWNVIIMMAGVSILIEMGTEAGMIDTLSSLINGNIPSWAVLAIITFIGALLSIFGNSLLVVGIMIPLAGSLVPIFGFPSPFPMLAAATLGAYMADASPFSSGGALILSAFADDDERAELFTKFIRNCFLIIAIVSIMSALGWTKLF